MVERLRCARPAGRHGADVPRPRAAASCATSGRRATTARRCPQLLDSKIPILGRLGAPAARPLPVHAGQGPRRRDRVGEVAADRAARVRARGRPRRARARAADPGRPVRPHLRRLRARQGARRAGSTSTTSSSRPSACSRTTPRPPTPSAPASAGSASTSTRTRARSSSGCSSCGWAIATDLCVVGDEDQTIYTFTGATSDVPDRRSRSAIRARGSLDLTRNYRSTPQVLELANRLIAADGRSKRLSASRGDGPEPTISRHAVRRGRAGRAGRARSASSIARTASRPPRSRCSSG